MKLYDNAFAPNPRRVRWFMAEKGIDDIEIVPVDLLAGEHRSPEYLSRTGIAHAPALTLDDGTTVTESVAICRYLESRYPEPNMFGRDPKEIAVIEMWTRRAELLAALPLMLAFRHSAPALARFVTQLPEVAAESRSRGERSLQLFDARLSGCPFIGAERITIADGILYIGMDLARLVGFTVPKELTHLARWEAAMRARPSLKAAA